MVKFVIPLPPVTKKNSQRIVRMGGKPIVIPSATYTAYEREAIKHLLIFLGGKTPPKINYPCNVACRFYMQTHRRVDLNNLLEAATDTLVSAGILEDDNSQIVVSHDGSRVFYDKENPRTVIEITKESEQEEETE